MFRQDDEAFEEGGDEEASVDEDEESEDDAEDEDDTEEEDEYIEALITKVTNQDPTVTEVEITDHFTEDQIVRLIEALKRNMHVRKLERLISSHHLLSQFCGNSIPCSEIIL